MHALIRLAHGEFGRSCVAAIGAMRFSCVASAAHFFILEGTKMSKLRKCLSAILCLILLIGTVAVGNGEFAEVLTMAASAEVPDGLKYDVSGGEVTIKPSINASGDLKIPSEIEGYPVTSIDDYAFYGCAGLTSITIPDCVTSIGIHAFGDCAGLMSISVESGNPKYHSAGNCLIETESKILIAGCNTSEIPNDGSVTSIGDYAFSARAGLTSVEIPEGVTSVGKFAFYRCTGLTSIKIPNSVTSIGDRAFYGCKRLTSVKIPNSVTNIGENAFPEGTSVTYTEITDGGTQEGTIVSDEPVVAIMYLCASGPHTPYFTGHAWICIRNISENTLTVDGNDIVPGEMVSFGLHSFKPNSFKAMLCNEEMDIYKGETVRALAYEITQSDLDSAEREITASRWKWYELFTHNCTNFAASVWNEATDLHVFSFCFPFIIQIQIALKGSTPLLMER